MVGASGSSNRAIEVCSSRAARLATQVSAATESMRQNSMTPSSPWMGAVLTQSGRWRGQFFS